MKILLIQPPVQDFYDTDIRLQPLGLAYLKAAVKKHLPKIKVVIKDYHAGWGRKTIPCPKELSYLKDFYGAEDKGPFSTFHHFYHFGADLETIAKDVAKERPDLVGISSLFSPYYREVLATAEAVKRARQVPIFIGGSHASARAEQMLAHPAIDLVIRGEGERPLVEFLQRLKRPKRLKRLKNTELLAPLTPFEPIKPVKPLNRVPNLGYKSNGKIILNPIEENYPVDQIPFPDLSDLPRSNYLYEGKPLCFVLTSRGCPYRCSFCSVRTVFGTRYRRRSNENILGELKSRYRQGYRVFDLEDDNLTFDRKAAIELFTGLARSFPKKDVRFVAMNGICYWSLDEELLKRMRQAGFTHLNLSLVSANRPLLKKMRRPLHLKKYGTVVSAAFDLGFKIVSYQILGLPGDPVASMIRTLAMNAKLPLLLGASPFYLTPSSPAASDPDADPFTARLTALGNGPEKIHGDIYTLFVATRILNFLKGIPLSGDCSLRKALSAAQRRDERSSMGVRVLKKLLAGEGFFIASSQGFKTQPFFRTELFFKLWRGLDRIVTQQGKVIHIKGGAS